MTQAFCHLVLHYSVARLSWKTIKSLRRSRSVMRRKNYDSDGNNEDVSTIEYEILQGWTILAFHSLYVSLGIEYFVRFFIPFYFHLKMIVLLVTFVVPSWGGKNGSSEFGLSPVISYWFDYLIVPSVNKVHEFMDNDPKGFAKQQIANLPLLVIDFIIAPGIFTSDEDKQLARKRISVARGVNGNGIGEGDKHKTPPANAFPQLIANLEVPDEFSNEQMELDEQQHQLISGSETKGESQSVPALGNITYIQNSFARRYEKQKTEQMQTTTKYESESIPRSPPRETDSSLFNIDSTPIRRSRISALTNSAILSPAVKLRLAASAKKLKRFSHEHQLKGGLLSPKRTTPRRKEYESLDDDGDSDNESTIQSPKLRADENAINASTRITRKKRRERLSFGDHFRELVTGDANIRVRDHLFDLEVDLPSSPRRRVRTPPKKEGRRKRNTTNINMDGLSPNVTTRRSSRLARKNYA